MALFTSELEFAMAVSEKTANVWRHFDLVLRILKGLKNLLFLKDDYCTILFRCKRIVRGLSPQFLDP